MSHLSKALRGYCSQKGKKIVFKDMYSLNQLALAMWEELGFRQIDASVLSRALKGERPLTAQQLKAFCTVLSLPNNEEAYLFACLEQDQLSALSRYTNVTRISSSLALDVMRELTKDSFNVFYRSEYGECEKKNWLVRQLADNYMLKNGADSIGEVLGLNLYLRGRMTLLSSSASQAVKQARPIYTQLIKISQSSGSTLLYSYAHALLSDAYYAAGGYSYSPRKRKFYTKSIECAKKAINSLPSTDREGIFALRTMAASAHYLNDTQTIYDVMKRTKVIIPKQPANNYVNGLHLCITLDKALAAYSTPHTSLFPMRLLATQYFRRDLAHTGMYEISAIKEEIDTLLLLKTRDRNYLADKLKIGIALAAKYKCFRHKRYLKKVLQGLSTP